MGLLDNESIPRRKMTLFFVIDTSGSMVGSKIGSVNDAIENGNFVRYFILVPLVNFVKIW